MEIPQTLHTYEKCQGICIYVELQSFRRELGVSQYRNFLLILNTELSCSVLYPATLEPHETELDLPVSAVQDDRAFHGRRAICHVFG
jgi:hypothetical protein